jgi:subtilisin family serine protease
MKLRDVKPHVSPVKISLPSVRTRNDTLVREIIRRGVGDAAAGRAGSAGKTVARVPPPFVERRLIVQFEPKVLQGTLRARAGHARPTVLEESSDQTALLDKLRSSTGVKGGKPLFAGGHAYRAAATTASVRSTLAMAALPGEGAPDPESVGWTVLDFKDEAGLKRALKLMEGDSFVKVVERVPTRWLTKIRAPSASKNRQWSLRAIGFFDAAIKSANEVAVAVLDSGVDLSNPLLGGAIIKRYEHYGWQPADLEQHGTHVAGIIAAMVDDKVGVSGLADTPIYAWKVIDDTPDKDGYRYVDFDDYARALNEVAKSGARVLNLSLGGSASSRTERLLFDQLAKAGVFVAAAMGNEYEDGNPVEYPAAYRNVHAVCAVDEVGDRATFSNTGRHAFISAPGMNVLSTMPTDGGAYPFGCLDGTSMATPHVSAAAALLLGKFPDLTVPELAAVLAGTAETARGQKAGKRSSEFGYGMLRLDSALRPSKVATLRKQAAKFKPK